MHFTRQYKIAYMANYWSPVLLRHKAYAVFYTALKVYTEHATRS